MKVLKDILYKAGIQEVQGSTNVACDSIHFDSRKVEEYTVFVAVRGTETDGHNYITKAIELGAVAIVCEEFPENLHEGITYVQVTDGRIALAQMACHFYDQPSKEIKLVGITGTNGKTTVATLLFRIYQSMGHKCGLLSTVVNRIHKQTIDSTHTTPNPVELNALLRRMVDEGCTYAFMEVSSHALSQHRTAGLEFDVAVFTNITHDHLDYHENFDAYIKAKKMLFDQLPKNGHALLNADDFHWEVMAQNCPGTVQTFGLKSLADIKGKIIENHFSGLQMTIEGKDVWSKLVGDFNASNLLAVYGAASLLGSDQFEVLTTLSTLDSVEGRFQYIQSPNAVIGIVDYAHTPDALKNVLATIQNLRTGNEQVITVVGAGGDRDRTKRPEMAKIACKFSDRVILTSDNPRSEDPESIIKEMRKGIDKGDERKVLAISNRREAIRTASSLAQADDIILVAGKGHENYQEINGVRQQFSDLEELTNAFNLQKD
uniref:UDP-N-acetylmuramoyl-L-alanyl-D-glutamate--2,6-diaminopimelate ligase n=1 Tax=uncultured Flavobacteriia bacterium TaxID=212695 RepID=H6RFW2_9BACT|nr:UDP-N-acetylmuramoylalanyl-D-glutamate--2,6- diaminopimelate ligase [uncultured bacterium]CCF99923.1 UDP-N-acetylmuramoyl-L-alanyl-D-glutamate--2, 6-diaminopimelate ligase [uncultured Flavobacteriia bacterium]